MRQIKGRELEQYMLVHDATNGETFYVERVNYDSVTDTWNVHGILFANGHAFPLYTATYNDEDGELYALSEVEPFDSEPTATISVCPDCGPHRRCIHSVSYSDI